MRTPLKSLLRERAGNVLTELALVAPFIVAVTLGIVDFGRGMHASMSLRSAARVGAEYVSRTGDTTAVAQVVADAANLDPATLSVTPVVFCECDGGASQTCGTYCPDGTTARQFISIDTRQPFSTLVPYPLVPNPLTLGGRAILRVK